MAWGTIALYVISFLISAFLSPKPKFEDARKSNLSDLKFPRANEGDPVPWVIGKVLIEAPNTLWYGGFRSVAIKKKIKTGMFSSKRVIIGWKYYITADLALCLGEDAVLHRIWIEKNEVWAGTLTGAPQDFTISKPSLFGGVDRSGGYSGSHTFYSGQFTEVADAALDALMPGDTPAYVGTSRVVLDDVWFGNSPNLRAMKFEVSRFTDGLGLAASGWLTIGEDINPMEALYQVFTDDWGALGKDAAGLDTASMITAAETLSDEGNGISLQVANINSGKDIIEEILRQVDGLMFQDATSGLLVVKLIRADYSVPGLPLFDENNVASITGFSRTAWDDTINQLRLTHPLRTKTYEEGVIMVQDAANIAQQSEVNATSLSFPGITTSALALEVATRELAQISVPLFKLTLHLDRTAYTLFPGAVIKVTWPNYNVVELILRVQKFRSGKADDSKIIVDCVQDVFAANQSVFSAPVTTGWVEPDKVAVVPSERVVMEVPYFLMKDLGLEVSIPPTASHTFLATLAVQENTAQQGFTSRLDDVISFPDPIEGVDHRPYTNAAKLSVALARTEGLVEGSLSGGNVVVIKEITPGDDFIKTATTAQAQEGENFFLINGEWFTFQAFTDNGDSTYNLETVRRALLDSTFEDHAIDDRVYFFSGPDEIVLQEFLSVDTIYTQFSSFSSSDETDITGAGVDSLTTANRYDRPLPVDYIAIDAGARSEAQVINSTTVTSFLVSWRERIRTSSVIQWENSSTESPEAGTTYTVVFKVGGVTKATHAGIAAGTSDPTPFSTVGVGIGAAEILITTHRDGYDSWVDAVYPFEIVSSDFLLLEDGFQMILEDGTGNIQAE